MTYRRDIEKEIEYYVHPKSCKRVLQSFGGILTEKDVNCTEELNMACKEVLMELNKEDWMKTTNQITMHRYKTELDYNKDYEHLSYDYIKRFTNG